MSERALHLEMMDAQMVAIMRKKTGAERLRIASDMYTSARKMLLSHLQAQHPDWRQEQICREAARRLSHGAL